MIDTMSMIKICLYCAGALYILYWLCTRFFRTSKVIFLILFGGLIYSLFQKDSSIVNIIILSITWIILVGSIKADIIVSNMRKTWLQNQTKQIFLRKNSLFHILLFILLVAYLFIDKFYPYYEIWMSIILCIATVAIYSKIKFIEDIITMTQDYVSKIDRKSWTKVSTICEKFDKKIIEKDPKLFMQVLYDTLNMAELENDNITRKSLGGTELIFGVDCWNELLTKSNAIIKAKMKVAKKDALSQMKNIIKLSDIELEDVFIYQDEINKYYFNDKEFFIHCIYLDSFVFCSCCGKAEEKNPNNETIEGEWFCSPLCEETESLCVEISEQFNPYILDNESYEAYNKRRNENILSNTISAAISTQGVAATWAKNYQILQNDKTGHGWAAEIMNHEDEGIWARITGKAKLVGGDNATDGADRLVNGVKIQTKYCKTATRSVNAAFDNKGSGEYRYIDENGKPMQIEVPKDQDEEAVKLMEEKIKQGKVKGVTDPKEARNLVRKGSATYRESQAYAKFCTKESLKYDARNGAITAVTAFGIAFVINTAICYYRQRDAKIALKESFVVGIKTGGKAFSVFMIGAQMQRIPAINQFLQQVISFEFKGKIGSKIGTSLARAAGKEVGKKGMQSAANSALRGTIVTAVATIAVTSSIEIVQMMRGQISGMQCIKNVVVNAGGIVGGAAGALAGAAALSFIPGAGTIVGGLVGGLIGGLGGGHLSKKIMDNFIEDDLSKKQRIFFEHMITLSILFKLSKEEMQYFRSIVDNAIQQDKDFFGKKFHVSNILPYANSILKPIAVAVVSNRPKLHPNTFDNDFVIDVIAEEVKESTM